MMDDLLKERRGMKLPDVLRKAYHLWTQFHVGVYKMRSIQRSKKCNFKFEIDQGEIIRLG